MLERALLLVDDRTQRRRIADALKKMDVLTESVRTAEDLWRQSSRETSDLLVISRSFLAEAPVDFLSLIRELPDAPEIVVLSDREDSEDRARLLSTGCVAVLFQGLPTAALRSVLEAVLTRRRRRNPSTIDRIRSIGPPRLSDFVSESETMRTFMSVVEKVAPSNTTLLVLGETGVGKERLAQAIHNESLRSAGPFVAVNCAALTESLLESELFGHEEGAFTGATRARRGCFELAHKGTLFLDEIGEMPLHLQVKLLRVLQQREVQRVGGERAIPMDVRVMAASNREIKGEVQAGRFRNDLYYRLSVVTLNIPPLRERKEDIPTLVDSYINYFRSQMSHRATSINSGALQALIDYHWPGNVRELINIIERALLLCPVDEIGIDDLPIEVRPAGVSQPRGPGQDRLPIGELSDWQDRPLADVLEAVERNYLVRQLTACQGRIGTTAERAGIDPRVLYEKMKRYGLSKEHFRPLRKPAASPT